MSADNAMCMIITPSKNGGKEYRFAILYSIHHDIHSRVNDKRFIVSQIYPLFKSSKVYTDYAHAQEMMEVDEENFERYNYIEYGGEEFEFPWPYVA